MTTIIDPALVSKHRAVLSTWDLMGKRIFTVKAEPADLNYNDRVRENDPMRTVKPIMKYMIEAIDIVGSRLVVLPDKTTVVIELNNDPSLQFKIGPAKFREVSMEAIIEAIDKNNGVLGREPILFTDCLRLTEQVNKLNALEAAKSDDEAERLLNMSKMLNDLNKLQLDSCDKYYDELGISSK